MNYLLGISGSCVMYHREAYQTFNILGPAAPLVYNTCCAWCDR